MKKGIIRALLALAFVAPAMVMAAANDLFINQRTLDGQQTITRTVTVPSGGQSGVLIYNGSAPTSLHLGSPMIYTLGPGLTMSGSVLDTVPPVVTWASITGKPAFAAVATSGQYSDLLGKPTIPAAQVNSDWSATSGVAAILNKPALFSGAYADLSGIPSTFPPAAHTHAAGDIVSGVLADARIPGLAISKTTGLQAALDAKYTTPAGTTAQYVRGDGSLAAFPTAISAFSNDAGYLTNISSAQVVGALGFTPYSAANPAGYVSQSGARSAISLTTTGSSGAATYNSATGVLNIPSYTSNPGTVTSITAGTGLSGGTITSSGTISMPNVGTAGVYTTVTTDAQGRVTAGTPLTINDAPGRTLVNTTSSTGFQISSTRTAQVCYEGSFATTSTIGGPSSASVFLETADTNSTTPGDWTTKAQQTYSNNITLAVTLNQVQGNNWSMCRYIPAGKFVRIRVGSVTGTASATINATQQETLM